tara:strand:- start:475 stop:627 length:153 start_codon:yes stop_codon:yes gene_type:complete
MNNSTPKYILDLIKKFPNILSGRKNYRKYHSKVQENLFITKKYFQKKQKK